MSDRLTKGTLISIDTETTGTDPAEARIVQLGVVVFEAGRCTAARSHLFHPGVPIPDGASAVHGIYDHHVARRPRLSAYPQLRALMASEKLVGYNLLDYDGEVLRAECARHLGAVLPAPGGIDALVFVRWHLRHVRGRRLTEICIHLGVELTDAHSAAADARAAGEVLLALVRLGHVPDDRAAALAQQARIRPQLLEEQRHWRYYLYTDRSDRRTLRLGYGRHCGRALEEEREYLRWAIEKHDLALTRELKGIPHPPKEGPLPPEVAQVFRRYLPSSTPIPTVHQTPPAPAIHQAPLLLFGAHSSSRAGLHSGSN